LTMHDQRSDDLYPSLSSAVEEVRMVQQTF